MGDLVASNRPRLESRACQLTAMLEFRLVRSAGGRTVPPGDSRLLALLLLPLPFVLLVPDVPGLEISAPESLVLGLLEDVRSALTPTSRCRRRLEGEAWG